MGTPAQFRQLLGSLARRGVSPRQHWDLVGVLLNETDPLGRRHTRWTLPPPSPDCALCGARESDGLHHILGVGEAACPKAQLWAISKRVWDPSRPWTATILPVHHQADVELSLKFLSTIMRMYRWQRFGAAQTLPGAHTRGASRHFEISDRGFQWAWAADSL